MRNGDPRKSRSARDKNMNANRNPEQSKTLRVLLAFTIACYLVIYAASTIWTLGYQPSRCWVCLASGAFQMGIHSKEFHDEMIARGLVRTEWPLFRESNPPSISRWPSFLTDLDFTVLVIPLWLPFLPLLALTAFVVHRDRTRKLPGQCRKCGYNLTGNTSGRCPECGVVQAIPPPASGRGDS